MTQKQLSSVDLLTIQVLEKELTEPSISEDYERELRVRIEYLTRFASGQTTSLEKIENAITTDITAFHTGYPPWGGWNSP